ncbi:carbohydrate ABC transporter permease [Georgenia alba]|uniref:Carbohydrate ABC transporter permease n=1 Tax=Georgenia alba TaxID=2233858 RepID=A0ABW2QBK4_9MICO
MASASARQGAARPMGGKRPHPSAVRAGSARRAGWWTPYVLVAPFFIAFLLFTVGPLLLAAYNSFFESRLVGGTSFVWFENYAEVFTDDRFWEGFGRILLYGAVFTPLTIGLSLFLALIVDAGVVRHGGFFRTLYFVPYAIPAVVATLMWGFLYGPTISPLSDVASWLGLDSFNLLDPSVVLFSIGNVAVWTYTGYNILVFFAALRSIPAEIYEAAVLDGAGGWRIAWSIKVPMIKPVLTMVAIFSIINTIQLFTEPMVLQPLAPRAIESNFTPNMYAYSLTAGGQQLNYVSALSFVLGAMVILMSVVYVRVTNRREADR